MGYVGKITDETVRRKWDMYAVDFDKIKLWVWMLTTNTTEDTKIMDLSLFYEERDYVWG